ncbi:MAG: valine--tRNA ligase [Methermicoccaceae archaeon]
MFTRDGELPKDYDSHAVEHRWQSLWKDEMYYFDPSSTKPRYIIDTPPPYPTGSFHIGNGLNWCYIDFIARYKRMMGYNVMFPQGWDCHGLPTEVKVEELHNITKSEINREEFRELCRELTSTNIEKMKNTMHLLGFSIDWSNEFITMHPDYYTHTQRSFVRMWEDGSIYRDEHPVNWCPRCETAIAYAEVEYEDRESTLNFLHFDASDHADHGKGIDIATTRPELLCSCVAVAVHPEDERYSTMVGKTLGVPVFGHEVPVIADEHADPTFGTGAVMICTFGDKQDVRWWKEHSLPLRVGIDRQGRMTSLAGKYAGMRVEECREAIIEDMKKSGEMYDQQPIEQSVGVCWRCKTPIEILSEAQWFVRIDHEEVLSAANEIKWMPSHMLTRLKNWVEGMEWDWCISRQRIFATPIPVWYCANCGRVKVASEDELPVDPTLTVPKESCECGSESWVPETDVLDTWMDSSISALYVGRWLEENYLPCQLRPQGHDIIRTWAFYTILRSKALTGRKPWETITINGMVLGEDGQKMSKSKGNLIHPEEVVEKHGSDAFRQWAALGGSMGSDVIFRWKDVVAASRFQQKLWSIARFSALVGATEVKERPEMLRASDRWILSLLQDLVSNCRMYMEDFQFDATLKAIRTFAWERLADDYVELVKGRLYGDDQADKEAACYTMYVVVTTLARLLAPFIPHITEEIYSLFEDESVHLTSYPDVVEELIDEQAVREGEIITSITAALRRYKSEHKLALNAPFKGAVIYTPDADVQLDVLDISNAINGPVDVLKEPPHVERVVVKATPNMAFIGPTFRKDAGKVVAAISSLEPSDIKDTLTNTGSLVVEVDGEKVTLPPDAVSLVEEFHLHGESVDVLDVSGCVVVVRR